MGERVERWKAREKVRSAVGWVAVFMGLAGLSAITGGIAFWIERIRGREETGWRWSGPGFESPSEPDFVWGMALFSLGVALLYCAYGLWNVRPWARWATLVLCLMLLVQSIQSLVRERSFVCWLPLAAFAVVYLLLPSTGKHFARAGRPAEAAEPPP
jgi:hypothetical protein